MGDERPVITCGPSSRGRGIAVECREGEPGYGGVRLEEIVLVIGHAHEVLTRWPADEVLRVGVSSAR
jgi:hypothetical protein